MLGPPDLISQYAPCVTLYVLARSLNPHDTGPFTDMCSCAAGAFGALVFVDLSSCPFDRSLRYFLRCCIYISHVFLIGVALCLIPDAGVAFVRSPLTRICATGKHQVVFCLAGVVPSLLAFLCRQQDGFDHIA